MNPDYLLHIYNTHTEELTRVVPKFKNHDLRPFGITWDNNHFYIAQPTHIIKLGKNLKSQEICLDNLTYGIHQILNKDGFLWMVSPRLNAIKRYSWKRKYMEYFFNHKWHPDPPPIKDINHYNSIFISSKDLLLSAHNHNQPSFIERFTYPNLKFIKKYQIGRQIHNLFLENQEILFTLDSLAQSLVSTNNDKIQIGMPGQFIRGLAICEDYYIIGRFAFNGVRSDRKEGDAELVIVDRKSRNIVNVVKIHGIGDINDIRILDKKDYASCNKPCYTLFL